MTAALDSLMGAFLHEMFFGGASLQEACETLYAVGYARGLTVRQLPRSHRALKGCRRLQPEAMRDPVAIEAVYFACQHLVSKATSTSLRVAAGILLQVDFTRGPS